MPRKCNNSVVQGYGRTVVAKRIRLAQQTSQAQVSEASISEPLPAASPLAQRSSAVSGADLEDRLAVYSAHPPPSQPQPVAPTAPAAAEPSKAVDAHEVEIQHSSPEFSYRLAGQPTPHIKFFDLDLLQRRVSLSDTTVLLGLL